MHEQNEIVLYQPNELTTLEVRVADETVWLSQSQIVELFASSKSNISEHIKNIYAQHELEEGTTVRNFRTVQQEGKRQVTRTIAYYNLDAIISIGFRVNTMRGIQFRQWANKVLKDYMLRGYALNQRLLHIESELAEHHTMLQKHEEKLDFFVKTALPPAEQVFFEGNFFEARVALESLVKTAKQKSDCDRWLCGCANI